MSDTNIQIRLALAGLAGVQAGLGRLSATMGGLATRAAGFAAATLGVGGIGYAMTSAVKSGIRYNAVLEQQTIAFKTLLGSMDQARSRVHELSKFAASTPFELPEVVNANRLLQTLTGGALATEKGMRLVGDAASAAGRSFEETAMWIGRLYAGLESGQPVGQASMRLLEMGLISGQVKTRLEGLATSGKSVGQAWTLMEEVFGKTTGAMLAQSKTFNGLWSTIKDGIAQFLGAATDPAFNAVKGFFENFVSIDFEAAGRRVGAFFRIVAEQWRSDNFAEFLALSIEAGFELGLRAGRRMWTDFVADIGSARTIGYVVLRLASEITSAIAKAITYIPQTISASIRWMVDQMRYAFDVFFNWFTARLADIVNGAVAVLNKLPGVNITRMVPGGGAGVQAATTWAEAWAAESRTGEAVRANIEGFFERSNAAARELLGINENLTGEQNAQGDAVTRLNRMIDQMVERTTAQAKATEQTTTAIAATETKVNHLLEMKKEEAKLQERLRALHLDLARVSGDFTKTEAEKFALRPKALIAERDELERIVRAMRERAALAEGAERETLLGRADTHQKALQSTEENLATMGADPNSIREQMQTTFTDLRREFGTLAENIARTFRTVIRSAVDGVADSIAGLIRGTMTWGDALRNIGSSILEGVINAIARMFAEWIVGRLAVKAVEIAASTAEGVAKAPAALFTSISSYGTASIVGMVAFLAAIAAIGAAAAGAFAEGGFTGPGAKYEPAGIVHRGEFVMPAETVSRVGVPSLEEIRQGGTPPDSGAANGPGVKVAVFDDRSRMKQWLRSQEGRAAVLEVVGQYRHEFT